MYTLLLLRRFSRVRLCATPWTAAHQAPPSMGFSRQEYWSGVPLPSPYTLLCIKRQLMRTDCIAQSSMLCSELNEKEIQRGDTCICVADSFCCTTESNTTL